MKSVKILIIEDELTHLAVMRAKLEKEGHIVVSATDGMEGYQKLSSEKPDIVLLDIILPSLNGFEILERARNDGFKAPIIVVSNSGQPVEVDRALELGAVDFLVKAEFSPNDVLEKVNKVLSGDYAKSISPRQREKASVMQSTGSGTQPITNVGQTEHSVLVVEDDKFLRDLIQQKLQKEGFQTLSAVDGEEGIKIVLEKQPQLVLLDLILPGADGFEVLRQLKSNPKTATIPVIVLSNLGQKEDMDRALKDGAEDFMVKAHFTPSEIVAKVRATIKAKYF